MDPLLVAKWLALVPEALLKTCKQVRYQGSGPGGQKRNRVYSGIRLVHAESGLAIESEASRESRRNLEEALHRLRLTLALSIAPGHLKPKSEAEPEPEPKETSDFERTELENSQVFLTPLFRANASPNHIDFPILVLRAIYFFDKYQGQTSITAQALGCTASALTRFFKSDKAMWLRAKEIREANGLHPLK